MVDTPLLRNTMVVKKRPVSHAGDQDYSEGDMQAMHEEGEEEEDREQQEEEDEADDEEEEEEEPNDEPPSPTRSAAELKLMHNKTKAAVKSALGRIAVVIPELTGHRNSLDAEHPLTAQTVARMTSLLGNIESMKVVLAKALAQDKYTGIPKKTEEVQKLLKQADAFSKATPNLAKMIQDIK